MEALFSLIGFVIAFVIIRVVFSAVFKAVGAAGKAALGKGSVSENMELAFKGMEELMVRFHNSHLNDDGTGPAIKEVEVKGLFPLSRRANVGFLVSVFDASGEELEPVLSVIDTFQEEDSIVYQHGNAIGPIDPDQGFIRWVRVGVVIPDMLQPPYGGKRQLKAIVRMVDLDNLPSIQHGFHIQDDPGIFWQRSLGFEWTFAEKGYQEATEHHDEAVGLSLKIGMAVAMADGSLDDEEGNVLKQWVVKLIDPYSDEKKERLKGLYNQAMKDSYQDALNSNLNLSSLTKRMNEIGEKSDKYEALELCYEVMAADGVADDNELRIISSVAKDLGLDMQEVSKMRDQKILHLNSNVASQANIEVMLGIEPDWTHDEIKKHLRVEFQKWNNRLNTLEEGEERDNAQLMLDRIAEARQKYAT